MKPWLSKMAKSPSSVIIIARKLALMQMKSSTLAAK